MFDFFAPRTRLLRRKDFQRFNRQELEVRVRALTQVIPLGDVVLCRVLGRYKMYIDALDEGFGAHLMLDGVWDGGLTIFMAREMRPGMNVVDAGANHGYYAILLADLVGPTGRLAAIEPHPRMADLLRRSVAINGFTDRIEIHERALGAVDGEQVAFWSPLTEPKNARVVTSETPDGVTFSVGSVRLATLLATWDRVDFIKVDVEGAEEAMMEGAWPLIMRDRPRVVLEFNAHRCREPAAFVDRLQACYGRLRIVTRESTTTDVSRDALLDMGRTEDWMLYLAP